MNILLNVPDDLVAKIDEIVQQRKLLKSTFQPLSEVQRLQMKEIAAEQGMAAATAYLKEIQQPVKVRASRVGVVMELIEMALPRIEELRPELPHIFNSKPNTLGRVHEEQRAGLVHHIKK